MEKYEKETYTLEEVKKALKYQYMILWDDAHEQRGPLTPNQEKEINLDLYEIWQDFSCTYISESGYKGVIGKILGDTPKIF